MGFVQAQDTFVAELEDGTTMRVTRGDVLQDGHELVKRDRAATGALFSPLETGEDEKPAKRTAAAKAQAG